MPSVDEVVCAPPQKRKPQADRNCTTMDAEGFESWKTSKTVKNKRLGGKKKVTRNNARVMTKKNGPTSMTGSGDRSGKGKNSNNREEAAIFESKAAEVSLGKSDGTVVISEEEYMRLQEMKQALEGTSRTNDGDASTSNKFSHVLELLHMK